MVAITEQPIGIIKGFQLLQAQINAALAGIYAAFGTLPTVANGTASTTNGTATTIATVAIPTNKTVLISAWIAGRRTGGSAGTTGDGAGYVLNGAVKNIASTVTIIGQSLAFTGEDQAGWTADLAVSTTNILVRVTGAADNNVSWTAFVETFTA